MRSNSDAELGVYDGRQILGTVVEIRPSRFAAFDARNRFLGEYPNEQAARDAICSHRASY